MLSFLKLRCWELNFANNTTTQSLEVVDRGGETQQVKLKFLSLEIHWLTLTARGSIVDVYRRQNPICRRQILTSIVDPRSVRLKIFIMTVDPSYRPRYSSKAERAN